jgi:phospholipid/cholesterol/gamma-HCH transport system substrate-binding protein
VSSARWGLVVVLAGGVILLLTQLGASPYVVRAEFHDADGLMASFAVREQGVVVGTVSSVSVTPRDTAMVTMDLDRNATPIGSGASASISPSNLLGEKYVQLDPGNPRVPLRSGTTIPIARTAVSPELDQVLDTFDGNTRAATAAFLTEEGDALLGRGSDLAATLRELPPSLDAARQLVGGLASDNVALGRLIQQSDAILASAAPQRAALGRLITNADGMFVTLASREQGLRGTIAQAPSAFAQLHRTLLALANAAPPLAQAAAGLQRTAPSLTQTLLALPGFTRAAEPTLRTLVATAPALRRLGRGATPDVRALRPTAARLVRFSTALAPISNILQHDMVGVLNVLQGWARAIGDRDGVGHIYRIEVLVPNNVITSVLGSLNSTPTGALSRTPDLSGSHSVPGAVRTPGAVPGVDPGSSGRPPKVDPANLAAGGRAGGGQTAPSGPR